MIIFRKIYGRIVNFSEKREFLAASLFFFLLVIVFFFPVIFGGKTLTTSIFGGGVMPEGPYKYDGTHPVMFPVRDPGAFNWQDEPLSEYVGNIIKNEHHLPLWNPNMGIGYPILAGFHLGVIFPLNWVPFIFSSELAWDIAFLIKFFLAGFLTYLFARKIHLEKKPSLLAGVVFMFSGYAMTFFNMPHFNIEVLIPLLLLAYELLLEKQTALRLLFCVLATALIILPGMPEATAFALMFGGLWFIFSLFFIHGKEIFRKGRVLLLFFAINVLAFTLTAIQILPFLELLKNSLNSHSDQLIGSSSIPFGTIASVFYPYLFNPLYGWVACFYYLGIATVILFFLALFSIRGYEKKEKKIIVFFSLFAFLMLAKVFGFTFINWIGSLPVLNSLIFPKYAAPAIIFSIAMVSAFGYSLLIQKRISFFNTKMLLIFTSTALLTLFSSHRYMSTIITRISESDPFAKSLFKHFIGLFNFDLPVKFIETVSSSLTLPYLAFVIFSGIFIFLAFWITALNTNRKTFPVIAILLFVIAEFYVYILPLERADRYDTFKKPPYIGYLQRDNTLFRIYGQMPSEQNAMLFPNTSSVFGIQDIRILMALVDRRYFMFLKNVLGVKDAEISTIRFTGNSQIPFDNKFFDLLNVKYFLSPPGTSDYTIVNQIANEGKLVFGNAEFFKPGSAELNKKQLQGFILHAPSKIEFPLKIDRNNLSFKYGIADTGIKNSDGVQFSVNIISGDATKQLLSDFINPQDKKYHKWQKADLDLTPYAGKDIIISLQANPGINNAFDQFFFGNFQASKENVVYDKEMTIIENKDVLPRAFVVRRAEKLFNPDEIFSRLKSPAFDIRNQIIIEKDLPENQLTGNNAPETDNSTAIITSYKDQEIIIETKMENDGFLVLTDQYYPGWEASIDGKEVEIYPTDYTFRSVYLKKGSHSVRFVYDPASYKIGKIISILTLLVLFGILWFEKRINIALK
ncbi:MAG: YfhO family protein [Patescibacteria group bacterium]|nr:YfhO family protein [Patescibacteria group bacterium]